MGDQRIRAWLYCRIDAPEDARGILKSQKKELQDYADQMGFEVVGASEDLGSGLIFERPGLAEFMKAAETGRIDVLVAKNLSRIGRNSVGTFELLHRLEQMGIQVYSPLEGEIRFEPQTLSLQ